MCKIVFILSVIGAVVCVKFKTVCENEIKGWVLENKIHQRPKPEFDAHDVKFYLYNSKHQRLLLEDDETPPPTSTTTVPSTSTSSSATTTTSSLTSTTSSPTSTPGPSTSTPSSSTSTPSSSTLSSTSTPNPTSSSPSLSTSTPSSSTSTPSSSSSTPSSSTSNPSSSTSNPSSSTSSSTSKFQQNKEDLKNSDKLNTSDDDETKHKREKRYSRQSRSNLNEIDKNLNTEFIVHGWFEDSEEPWVDNLTQTYLEKSNMNIILIDYSKSSKDFYSNSVQVIEDIGKVVAEFLKKLDDKNLIKIKEVHLIGFGLGAHVSGSAGKQLQEMVPDKKLCRITGLDPPDVLITSRNSKLQRTDANFVDVIHTNNNWLGTKENLGQVDFQMNDGKKQPNCLDTNSAKSKFKSWPCEKAYEELRCSHLRSVEYWTESVLVNNFVSNGVIMGEFGSLTSSGNYKIKTNSKPPYGKG